MCDGTGMYSLREATRLVQAQSRDLNRWLFGYHYQKGRGEKAVRAFSAPLWKTQVDLATYDEPVIGFRDLLEARFVQAFIAHGVPLAVIRRYLENAQAIYGVEYPFTTLQFKTDGKTIFGDAIKQVESEGAMVGLRSRQGVFKDIIHPSLYAGIEYSGSQATRWYPASRRDRVVLDPSRQFGSPIIEDTGMPTDALCASFLAEGASDRALHITSEAYNVAPRYVRSAVKFEESLRRTAN
ncbi:DUF433 domain-containing protein [Achromobacter pestifer]|uniref:DUF433 domain-containing protein n=1 Tax=Achromobacter pestifer TaxID=1353889 RepID=A0A7D4HQ55_9BURK|nr:DUF433 domain-containing protein [Achromobacter pestifer]QKH35079.1 DUF433 domain-containing protein [Achromobacter pestifer]